MMHPSSPLVAVSESPIARAVNEGLGRCPRQLPPWLFYDAKGSALYERITTLDEYYPTRTERLIFETQAAAIVEAACPARELTVVELGAGTATKTELLLQAWLARGARPTFVPVDVSPTPLEAARQRLAQSLPKLRVRPKTLTHAEAFPEIRKMPGPKVLLFVGSSIGNFEDDEALVFLAEARRAMGRDGALVLGTDLAKSPEILVPAYDDRLGVTAAFNKNVLTRINRELGGHFDLASFEHVALWNAARSRIEMHLESTVPQRVQIEALDKSYAFEPGERIHTESSVKYEIGHVDDLLEAAGLQRRATFTDPQRWFAVHVIGG